MPTLKEMIRGFDNIPLLSKEKNIASLSKDNQVEYEPRTAIMVREEELPKEKPTSPTCAKMTDAPAPDVEWPTIQKNIDILLQALKDGRCPKGEIPLDPPITIVNFEKCAIYYLWAVERQRDQSNRRIDFPYIVEMLAKLAGVVRDASANS